MKKLHVAYVLESYPQLSETYIKWEIEALKDDYDISVIRLNPPHSSYKNHLPFQEGNNFLAVKSIIDELQPDILHSHFLTSISLVGYVAGYYSKRKKQIPFTLRAHSFDVIGYDNQYVKQSVPFLNSELCLGVLTFPFTRSIFEKEGIENDKIHDCYPTINFSKFHDSTPNGDSILSVASGSPKKKLEDFLQLASSSPDLNFNLYTTSGSYRDEIKLLNDEMNNPVNIMPSIQPEDMPKEYKKHKWLVYTASREHNTVGWPVSVAEAQAAGVGVCFPNLRPDLEEYLGGAGFFYDSISEIPEIISKPFPEEMRQKGFEQARKSDIQGHKTTLTELWQ